ncbi:Protein PMR5 [Hibiscus syriacus]|uniref:Protein PMR5 n=1 Tax=Hibiscus syriacus TaxID=106335 RepID=A0A6A3B903_HIBSY|nr:Protein PMR5 [Hibiscus syriacus]
MSLRNHRSHPQHRRPMFQTNQTTCALFAGTWVRDDSYPLYQYSSCPAIDPQFNCQLSGRPDSDYLKYRWKPLNCQLPRFDGVAFLSKMRGGECDVRWGFTGKKSMGVFDLYDFGWGSTNPDSDEQSNASFHFQVPDIDVVQGKKIVKLDDIAGNGNAWRMADVLVFNTGHWWTHEGSLQGWDMIQSGGKYYQEMDRLVAMEKGLRTWPNWVDTNVDISRTRVFFQAISPDHYDPSEWSAGATVITTRNCYGETTPMEGTKYTGAYADQTRVLDEVIREMHVPVYLLDITMLSELRKDGHPSIYSGDISPSQRSNPAKSADCSHWCLPGLPDTWNELFYTVLFY